MTAEKLQQRPRPAGVDTPTDVLDLALAAVAAPLPALAGASRWWVTEALGGIELHATPCGNLPAPVQRLTRLAAGPALLAVRLAVAVGGRRPFTTLFPDPSHPGVLAIVRQGAAAPPTQTERVLFAALLRRGPRPFLAAPGARAALPLLWRAAETEGAWTRSVCDPGQRARLAAIGARDTAPDDQLLVLGTHHRRPAGDVEAGQAMHRVLLTARSLGLHADVLAGPPELAGLRQPDLPGAGTGLQPQVVLAVGRRLPRWDTDEPDL